MRQKKPYIVNNDGWCAGRRVKEGDQVNLTPGQAKYEDVTPDPAAQKARDVQAKKSKARK